MRVKRKYIRLGAEMALGILFLVILGVAYAYSLAAKNPGEHDADWQRAAQYVRARWQRGDYIHVTPVWELMGLRRFKGLAAGVYSKLEKDRLGRFGRIWVAAGYGRAIPPSLENHPPMEEKVFGEVKLTLFVLSARRRPYTPSGQRG